MFEWKHFWLVLFLLLQYISSGSSTDITHGKTWWAKTIWLQSSQKKNSSNSNKELLIKVTLKRFNCQSSLKATVSLYRKHWKWCPVTTKNKFCLEQFKISSADPSWFKIDTSNQWYLTTLHKFPNLRPKSTDLSFLLAIWLPQGYLKKEAISLSWY